MPKMSSPLTFEYTPDEELSAEENIQALIVEIIDKTNNGSIPYKLQIILPSVQVDAQENRKMLEQAMADAIELEKGAMVPVGVDADGNALYKRQDAVTKG